MPKTHPQEKQSSALNSSPWTESAESKSKNDHRYESLVHSIDGIVWEVDPETFTFTFVSNQAERILGYPVKQWLEEKDFWVNHIHPDDRTWAVNYCVEATSRGEDHKFEYRMFAADGRIVWLSDIVTVDVADDGRLELHGVMVDVTERKIAERKVQRISERLQLATSAASIGIWDWDIVRDVLIWDDQMYNLFGIRKEDFTGAYDAWANALAPADLERATEEVRAALRGDREFDMEYRVARPDGSIRFIKAASKTFRDSQGRPLRMVGANYDITERKLAEEQINFLQAVTLDVASTHDLTSALKVVLRHIDAKTGWALGQAWIAGPGGLSLVKGLTFFAEDEKLKRFRDNTMTMVLPFGVGLPGLVWESKKPQWVPDVTKETDFPRSASAAEAGLKAALGVPIVSGDEVIAVLEFFLRDPREEDERLVKMILAVAVQIGMVCSRKLAEERLRWSEEQLRLILDSAAEGIFGVDLEGRCTFCNSASLRLLGYDHESELLGKRMHELIASKHADGTFYPSEECPVIQSIRTATRSFSEDDVFWRKDGTYFPTQYWAYPMLQGDKHVGAVVTFLDITERKLAEESLRLSEERFAKAFHASPEPITIFRHRDSTLLEANERWQEVYGYSREEVLGRKAEDLGTVSPEDCETLRALLEKYHSVKEFEIDFITKTGEVRNVSLSAEQIVINGEVCEIFLHRDITESKQALEKLRREQYISETSINSLPGVFYLFNSQGRYLRWNKNLEKMTGYTHDEIAEMHPLDFFAEEDKAYIQNEIGNVMTKGEATAEANLISKDGSATPYFFTGHRVDLKGEPCLVGMGIDISERKRAEDEIRKQKEILQKIFDNAPIGINFFAEDGRLLLANRMWEQMYGWTVKELEEEDADIFIEAVPYPGDTQRARDFVAEASGEWSDFYLRKKDGSRMSVSGAVVLMSDGMRVGFSQDVTERRKTEEELRESKKELNDAQRLAKVGSWVWDIESDSVTWSEQLYRANGIDPSKPAPSYTQLRSYYTPESAERLRTAVERAVQTGTPFELELEVIRPNGLKAWTASRGEALRDKTGKIVKLRGTVQDITERKRAEAELIASKEQLRALTASLSKAKEEEGIRIARELHDELGAVLSSLKWSLAMLDKDYEQNSEGESRAKITEMVGMIDETINTVRRISSELRPGVLDDLGLIAAIEWHAQQFQSNTGIVCRFESLLENVALSREQSTAVFRIFQETMTNVLRHSQATRVNILVEEDEGDFILEVTDNGRGITEQEKLGTHSLGLLGMRERAHSFGGKVEINSTPGKRTTVIVRVPLVTELMH